jgi:alpha-D-xyloside xylohydrolase
MLGDSLLVAPVFSPEGGVEYYVPAGRWTSFLTGDVKVGPAWVKEVHDFMSIPLLVRPGSVIAVGSCEDRPDYEYCDDITLHIYEPNDGMSVLVSIPGTNGGMAGSFKVERDGSVLSITCTGSIKRWKALLIGMRGIAPDKDYAVAADPRGALLTPAGSRKPVRIRLS